MIVNSEIRINYKNKSLFYMLLVFGVLQFTGFLYIVFFFFDNGYLPSPFHYDKTDTFMDYFNTLYWAYDSGRYSDWHSVYPPLVFIIMRLVNFLVGGLQLTDPYILRHTGLANIWFLFFIYMLVPLVIVRSKPWLEITTCNKVITYLLIVLSTPMLFAFERGNLIIIVPAFMVYLFAKDERFRKIAISILINIKPYFALLLLHYLIESKFSDFIKTILISGFIFILTGIYFDPKFYLFFYNLIGFSQDQNLFSLREVMQLPSSVSAFSYALNSSDGAVFISSFVGFKFISIATYALDLLKWLSIFGAICVMYVKRRFSTTEELLFIIVVIITNLGVWVGGYSTIYYIVFIPFMLKMRFSNYYIAIMLLLSANWIALIPIMQQTIYKQELFLSGLSTKVDWALTLGGVLSPLLNILLLIFLVLEICQRKINCDSTQMV